MATPTKTTLENINSTLTTLFQLRHDYSNSFKCTMSPINPVTKLVGTAFKLIKKRKLRFCAHVLHITFNLAISRCCFAEDGNEMYQNLKRACRAIAFKRFAALSLSSQGCGELRQERTRLLRKGI